MPEDASSSENSKENQLKLLRERFLRRASSCTRKRSNRRSGRRRKAGDPPPSPPPVDFSKYTEEEIGIISAAFRRQLSFDREIFRLQRGLQEASQEIDRGESPEPQDTSEICRMCDRVRLCGEILSINRKKYYWICESCQLRYAECLKSGGWFHGYDSAYHITSTTKLLEKCKQVQHMGISNDLLEMVYHQTRVGTIKITLLYDEPMKTLMVGTICADELDVDLDKVEDRDVIVQAYVSPRLWSERLTKVTSRNYSVKPYWDQIFVWTNIESVERLTLQLSVWVGWQRRLIGMTELPLGNVPLNDKAFWLQLFPGEGKEVYKPQDIPKPAKQEKPSTPESEGEAARKKKKKNKKGEDERTESDPTRQVIPPPAPVPGKKVPKQLKVKSDNLKWTMNVFKSVVDRQREEEKKANLMKLELMKQKQESAEHHRNYCPAKVKKKKPKKEGKTIGVGKFKMKLAIELPIDLSASDRDSKESDSDEDGDEDEANSKKQKGKDSDEERDTKAKGPKLLELASQHNPEVSPLHNEVDYRLDNETNVEYWRERLMTLMATQFDIVSTALPWRAHALRVQAPRLRSKDLYYDTVITERQDMWLGDDDSDEDDVNGDEVLMTEDNDGVTGPAQVRKRKNKGAVANGEVLIILQKKKDDSIMLIVKEARNLWNYHPSELIVYFALVKDGRHFLRQKRHGIKGAPDFEINLSRSIQRLATVTGTHFQVTFTQKDPKSFIKSVPVVIGEVIIDADKLPIPERGFEIEHWYPLIPSKDVRLIMKMKKAPPTLMKAATLAANVSAVTLPSAERSTVRREARAATMDPNAKKKKMAAEKALTLPAHTTSERILALERLKGGSELSNSVGQGMLTAANVAIASSGTETPARQTMHSSMVDLRRTERLLPHEIEEREKKSRSLGAGDSLAQAHRSLSLRELFEGKSSNGRGGKLTKENLS